MMCKPEYVEQDLFALKTKMLVSFMNLKFLSPWLQQHGIYLVWMLPADEACLSFGCSFLTQETSCGLKWVEGMWHASPPSNWYGCQAYHNNVCRFGNNVNELDAFEHQIAHNLFYFVHFQSQRPNGESTLQNWKVIIGHVKSDRCKDMPWHINVLSGSQLMIWTISLVTLIIY